MYVNFSKVLWTIAIAALVTLPFANPKVRAAMQGATGAVSGIDLTNLDRTCQPCQDFYQFANGGWIKKHPLPAAFPSYGAFTVLALHNRDVLHTILDQAAASNAPAGTNEQKIGDFYATCMNETAIEQAGTTPLDSQFALIDTLTSNSMLPSVLAKLNQNGSDGFFDFGSEPDPKNSTMTIAGFQQSGLGLPNRDYYFNSDAASVALRTAYVAHVTQMFTLLGESASQAAADAATVMLVETSLAKASLSQADMRDPEKMYHPMSTSQLTALAPNFNWNTYLSTLGTSPSTFDVSVPSFLTAFSDDLTQWKPVQIRTYLRWHLVSNYAPALPKAFEDAHFDFFSRTLQGAKQQLPRWQRCVGATDSNLGEALGQVYVQKAFSTRAKAEALDMVHSIKAELRDDISTLSWMSDATRQKAVAKLDAFTLKIGYPDKWRDYSTLTISRDSYANNLIAVAQFKLRRDLAKIDKPVDRTEWGMTPPTVNAYYNPTANEIVFPAGILQPPFFNPNADPAVNYGAIGAVIGHESTHGFDDSGRKFDAQGNLVDWWAPADALNFDKRKQCIIDQFDALEPVPGVHENGRLVTGEAIADLGGVTIAYKAFEKWQSTHPRRTIDGFSPEQRFFLGFASVWASVETAQYTRFLAASDVHPYDKFRVNATLANIPGFAQAWFCKFTDPMVRPAAERCQIW